MANLVITNANFTAGSTIVASQFNTNFSDISTYINNRNAGTTAWDGLLVGTGTFTNTTNQFVLGTTNTTTISATAPASSAVYTIPDVGTTANFILSTGSQTITGSKTFASSALLLQENGGTDVVTIAVASLASGVTYTVPDAGGAASFVMTAGNQTITGAKTFTGNTSVDNTKLQIGGNQSYPIVQVVSATTTTVTSSSATGFTSTSLTLTITPKFNTSKILLQVSGCTQVGDIGSTNYVSIFRGASNLGDTNAGLTGATSGSTNQVFPVNLVYYDSPATTSATTYTVKFRSDDGGSSYWGKNGQTATQSIIAIEIAQ